MGFALFIMLEDEYGVKSSPERFRELKTVADLADQLRNIPLK